jgi:hypothetical protein
MLFQLVHKARRWRLNIKVKERPFAEGSRDHSCARAFYFESNRETENVF